MSKEKQCECCHEWWYGSDVKENLCPNCYDYFKQLKRQLKEKDKLLKCYQEEEKLIADILGDKDLTIIGSRVHLKNLIVELKNKIKDKDIVIEEKDKEIAHLKEKDNYHLRYELAGADETITNLKQQLEEKDKENEELKLKLDIRAMNLQNINTERMEAVRNQTQLAIQELEKVKNFVDGRTYCADYINKRIQDLKGE